MGQRVRPYEPSLSTGCGTGAPPTAYAFDGSRGHLRAAAFRMLGSVIVERTPATTKKLASRARRTVQGSPPGSRAGLEKQRHVAEAFLAGSQPVGSGLSAPCVGDRVEGGRAISSW